MLQSHTLNFTVIASFWRFPVATVLAARTASTHNHPDRWKWDWYDQEKYPDACIIVWDVSVLETYYENVDKWFNEMTGHFKISHRIGPPLSIYLLEKWNECVSTPTPIPVLDHPLSRHTDMRGAIPGVRACGCPELGYLDDYACLH